MGRLIKLIAPVLLAVGMTSVAHAAPTIDSINVQGYMRRANGLAVTDGTYTLAFGVFQNSVNLWARSYSVTVTNGLFSRTISGLGGDLSALPAGTGMNSDFSATGTNTTLNAALLVAGGSTAVTVRVYAVTAIDGTNPQFDLTLAAVPTAMVCEAAKGVVAGSVTVAGLAAAAYTTTSAGAGDVGKLVVLDAAGKFDATVLPNTIGNTGAGGVTTVAGGTGAGGQTIISSSGTGASAVAIDAGAAGGSVNITANTTGNIVINQGTTSGVLTLGSASSTGGATLQGAGPVLVTSSQAAAGAVTVSTTGAGVSSTLITSNGTSASAVNLTTTGVGGGITLAPEATGNLIAGGGATSGSITVGNASTGLSTFGNTGAGSATVVRSGSGGLTITSAGTVDLQPTGILNIGTTGNGLGVALRVGTGNLTIDGNVTVAATRSIATAVSTVTLANAANNDVAIGDGSYFRVAGPTQGFSLSGMTGGADGRMVTIENGIAKPMLIATNTGSAAANQIQGEGCVLTQYGTASFVYNGTLQKWVQTSCNIGSAPSKAVALVAATTYNSGAPLVTDGAEVIRMSMTGNFAVTLQCIALDTNNSLTPYVGQELTIIFNVAASGGAASNLTSAHNTACAAPGYTIRTSTAANVLGTAANNGVFTTYVFDGTYWILKSILL